MGTRGCWGFRLDGKDYLTYNQCDSGPRWLGQKLSDFVHRTMIRDTDAFDGLKSRVRGLKLIRSRGRKPTKAEQKLLERYSDTSVASGSTSDWYVLLRRCQGDVEKTLESGYMVDSLSFMWAFDCEWAYVINLDDMTLEVYNGSKFGCEVAGGTVSRYAADQVGALPLLRVDRLDKLPYPYGEVVQAQASYGKYATLARVIERVIDAAVLPFDFGLRFYGGIEEYDRGGGGTGRKIVFYANLPDKD